MNPYTLWPYGAFLLGTFLLVKPVFGPWPTHNVAFSSDYQTSKSSSWLLRTRDVSWYTHIMLPIYMLHQFEEHGIDLLGRRYAFQPILCNMLQGNPTVEGCVATDIIMMFVNIGTVWGWGLLGRWGRPSGPGANFLGLMFINFIAHIVQDGGKYNPGFFTAVTLFLPVSCFGYKTMLENGTLAWQGVVRSIAVSVIEHAFLMASYIWMQKGLVGESTVLVGHVASNLLTALATKPV